MSCGRGCSFNTTACEGWNDHLSSCLVDAVDAPKVPRVRRSVLGGVSCGGTHPPPPAAKLFRRDEGSQYPRCSARTGRSKYGLEIPWLGKKGYAHACVGKIVCSTRVLSAVAAGADAEAVDCRDGGKGGKSNVLLFHGL